jgi:hypothetical protein
VTDIDHPMLTIRWSTLTTLLAELAMRGQGRREAGAFLLAGRADGYASAAPRPASVIAVAYYDDLDPVSLTGGITFGAAGYAALNARCRAEQLRVVADIHTHPRRWVGQSALDAAHPMSATKGHIAIIAPDYGQGRIRLPDLGVHIFNAPSWTSNFGDDVSAIIEATGSEAIALVAATVCTTAATALRTLRKLVNR